MSDKNSHSGRVLPIVLSILALVLLGAAVFFAYRYHHTKSSLENVAKMVTSERIKADQSGGSSATQFIKKLPESDQPVFENVGEFVVNLDREQSGGQGYVLQTNVQVQLYSDKDRALINAYRPKIKDHVLRLLASKKYEDLRTGSGKDRLGRDVILAVERAIGKRDAVYEVLFTSFIIQEQ